MTGVTKRHYEALADFRYQLRRFLRYSEQLCREHRMTPLQYQLLLQIAGYPGREWATITELAERLQAAHHGVVSLVTRCEIAGFVSREPDENNRRVVHVKLTAKGARAIERLAALHRDELLRHQRELVVAGLKSRHG
jgi:DNA-binding MarR family transcriptional regulator